MEPLKLRNLVLGSVAVIVLTQIGCTVWIGRQLDVPDPTDNSAEFAAITAQLASIESAIGDVQATADGVQARTQALTDSMGSVARACSR
jgi:hypothetical protein